WRILKGRNLTQHGTGPGCDVRPVRRRGWRRITAGRGVLQGFHGLFPGLAWLRVEKIQVITHSRTLSRGPRVSGPGLSARRDKAGSGIDGWPAVSMTRASKKLTSCLAAVDR